MVVLSKYSSGNVIKRYLERLFFFDVWSVFVAFNGDIFKWVTQCATDITMDLRFFFFLAAMGGNERHSGILLLILFKENKITTA